MIALLKLRTQYIQAKGARFRKSGSGITRSTKEVGLERGKLGGFTTFRT